MSELLSIVNLPATEEALKAISEKCKDKLSIAESMACTDETKQAVKKLRADLNREFASYEAERKERTAEYEKPSTKNRSRSLKSSMMSISQSLLNPLIRR